MYEKIDQYVIGKLSAREMHEVERYASESDEFKSELDFRKTLVKGLAQAHVNDLKSKLMAFENQEKASTPETTMHRGGKIIKIRQIRFWMALAAGVAILVFAGYWVIHQNNGDKALTYDDLFAANWEVPIDKHFLQSRNNQEKETEPEMNTPRWDYYQAILHLKSGTFEEAKKFLYNIEGKEDSLTEDEKSDYWYLMGAIELEAGEYQAARRYFEMQDASEKYNREWYLALMLLKMNVPKEEISAAFDKIAQSSKHPFKSKAKKVLDQLDKIDQ